jgi:hypothetical protein
MASTKVMAKLQSNQHAIAQLAEYHSRQGSSLTTSRKANGTRWPPTRTKVNQLYLFVVI